MSLIVKENWSHQLPMSRKAMRRFRFDPSCVGAASDPLMEGMEQLDTVTQSASVTAVVVLLANSNAPHRAPRAYDAHPLRRLQMSNTPGKCMQRRTLKSEVLALHSLLVSMTRSPSTRPHPPRTRSPLLNSSTICGFMSLQSGQMRRTARCRPYVGYWTFCADAASGNGWEEAMINA